MMDERHASAAVFPQLRILSYIQVQCYLPFWPLRYDFGKFSDGVCHVVKITVAESTPDTGTLKNLAF